jgi:hypothetical protein
MLVETLVENYEELGLPEEFVDILPIYCPSCGSMMEIGEALTGLSCSNQRCVDKLVMRIKGICKALNITDFGEATIEKYILDRGITNHLEMFALDEGELLYDGASEKISDKVTSQIEQHKEWVLWEFIQIANLPFIQTSARKIFQGYTDIYEAYDEITDGGVEFIQEKLGINDSETLSVQALKIYGVLKDFEQDLKDAVDNYITLIDLGDIVELNVVCSDQVGGGFSKKSEFYNYVSSEYGSRVKVHFLSSVNKTIDYLVWAGADGSDARYTSKVKKVEGYNDKGCDIPIVTATDFIETLEELY